MPKFGGNPNVLSAIPEIRKFVITDDVDFAVLACDGVFDTLESQDMLDFTWNVFG
jgi:protein phosphatase PTC2/3